MGICITHHFRAPPSRYPTDLEILSKLPTDLHERVLSLMSPTTPTLYRAQATRLISALVFSPAVDTAGGCLNTARTAVEERVGENLFGSPVKFVLATQEGIEKWWSSSSTNSAHKWWPSDWARFHSFTDEGERFPAIGVGNSDGPYVPSLLGRVSIEPGILSLRSLVLTLLLSKALTFLKSTGENHRTISRVLGTWAAKVFIYEIDTISRDVYLHDTTSPVVPMSPRYPYPKKGIKAPPFQQLALF